jgi:hypothetical protein
VISGKRQMPVGGEQCGVIFQKQKRNAAKMLIIDNVAKTLYPRVTKGIKIYYKNIIHS